MREFDRIHLVWRKGAGDRRHSVGILQKSVDGTYSFRYSDEARNLSDFSPYPEFLDLRKTYSNNVVEIFGQRLTKTDRPDIHLFFDFWEVDATLAHDKFYLLGKTQGLVATDNFEFLAEYRLTDHTHFLTEIASLSHQPLEAGTVSRGDLLHFELERDNKYDEFAVKVFKTDRLIGYIKKYHNRVFYQQGAETLCLKVKALEQNGIIKRLFVKVYQSD